jgi:RNA recognition motif-containing protein
MASIYVANLPFKATAADLHELFQTYGEIEACRIVHNGHYSQGFGFVDFVDEEACTKCLGVDVPIMLNGRRLRVERSKAKEEPEDTIFVRGIGVSVTKEDLQEHFSAFGVVDVKITAHYEDQQRRGFGFVKVSSKQNRDDAVKALNGSELCGRRILVDVSQTKFEGPGKRQFRNHWINTRTTDPEAFRLYKK